MKKKPLFYQVVLGLLIGLMLIPPQMAQAQWTVYDPAQYALQISKKVQEAARWVEHYQKLVEQLTTLKGVLGKAEDMVGKQNNAIATMSNIGRTVRGAYQLKNQVEAIVTTRLKSLKSIDDRLRNGIFDPEADLRDFDEYLKSSIGQNSQDTIANRERLARMDNELEKWHLEMKTAENERAKAEAKGLAARDLRDIELAKPESERCASCIASLNQEMASYDMLIAQLTAKIADLQCQIENRVKQYNIKMEERVRFGQQVMSTNDAWSQFNDSLDELQRTLRKVD